MEMEQISSCNCPPGFRFHPSDEELIVYYLMKKLGSCPPPAAVVTEIELYKYDPWQLPEKALYGEDEWYFFTPRDRKYPNGARPNRMARSGFWKATGTDKTILTSSGSRRIGVKKALVFYTGRPPKGEKTDWIMTEYRLPDTMTRPSRSRGSMRLDDWVLCRIRQKGNMSKNTWADEDSPGKWVKRNQELPSDNTEAKEEVTADDPWNGCPLLTSVVTCPQNATFPIRNSSNSNPSSVSNDQTSNAFAATSFFESFPDQPRPYLDEDNGFNNLIDSNNMVTDMSRNEVFLPGRNMTANSINFYYQNQAPGNMFNLNPSAAMMNLILTHDGIRTDAAATF